MATTSIMQSIPLAIIPVTLTRNGAFFRSRYITTYDSRLSSNPFSLNSDDALLSELRSYCDFTRLDNLPPNFDIQYDINRENWVQLVNPPPHLNTILIETMQNVTTRSIYKVIIEAKQVPISASDLLFHPRLGVGITQGIINQLGHFVQLLISFRSHEDKGGLITFVAVWIHYSHVVFHNITALFVQVGVDDAPETDFELARSLVTRVTNTEYKVDVVLTTDE
ncbi:hypothetical protein BDN71DRAFT_1436801 [Pleurotus eryngii]|uniref:Uncharacterized protein n=1 Tax=Pleurotus eryngii TaxID=5323 RepID=A0A9P5ZI62_PLEER|nr:hypothetical protein BDN71DRAFT_1436801 [Pleurotus eryngii]